MDEDKLKDEELEESIETENGLTDDLLGKTGDTDEEDEAVVDTWES